MFPFNQLVTFLYTHDLEASSAFYGTLLELPLVLDQGPCRIYQICSTGFVGICTRGKQSPPTGATNTVIVTLVCDDVDAAYERLRQRGVEFEKPPALHPNYQIYHCLAPMFPLYLSALHYRSNLWYP